MPVLKINMNKEPKPNLADARMAALRLILLPDKYEDLTESDRSFLRSGIVGDLLDGRWPTVFSWTRRTYGKPN